MKKFGIAIFIIVVLGAVTYGAAAWYYNNTEVDLSNRHDEQGSVCMAYHDVMWKSIKQVAMVPDAAKGTFKEIYLPLMEGRYGDKGSGALFQWIQENHPEFDWSLYGKVQDVIEAKRQAFFEQQKLWIAIHKQHKDLLEKWPGSYFVGDRDTLAITIITSTNTEKVYETGKDDDIELF
ncbi:MAG: hypothetical protein ABH846_03630 [Patescibacteria group bacterium]